jgi:hypothetical protein
MALSNASSDSSYFFCLLKALPLLTYAKAERGSNSMAFSAATRASSYFFRPIKAAALFI